MSVINQVLNELEKRGEGARLGEAALRSVPLRRQIPWGIYAAMLAGGLLGVVATFWYLQRESIPAVLPQPKPAQAHTYELVPGMADAASSSMVAAASAVAAQPEIAASSSVPAAQQAPVQKVVDVTSEPAVPVRAMEGSRAAPQAIKKISPRQQAEHEYEKAELALQQGHADEALAGYEAALLIDPYYKPARLAWVGELLRQQRNDEAEQVLQRGVRRDPRDVEFAMLLARVQVARDALDQALASLERVQSHAPDQADYHAFLAALLQRKERHHDAVQHYRTALEVAPETATSWVGLGISLQAIQQPVEAKVAFQRALESPGLDERLRAFVERRMREM